MSSQVNITQSLHFVAKEFNLVVGQGNLVEVFKQAKLLKEREDCSVQSDSGTYTSLEGWSELWQNRRVRLF